MNFDEFKKQLMQDTEFKKAYDDLEPEYAIIRAMIDGRSELNLSQQELARRTGINQAHISRLESGNYQYPANSHPSGQLQEIQRVYPLGR